MSVQDTLKKIYYDPKQGLLSKTKFIAKVKRLHPEIKRAEVEAFVKKQELQQVNQKGTFKGYFKIVAPPRHYQADIFFMSTYKRSNDNTSAFVIFIDILSRKMFVYPIKSKSQENILGAIKKLKGDAKEVYGLYADDEFSATKIQQFCKTHKIHLRTDIARDDHRDKGNRLGIVDAATRTIKTLIRNYMLTNDTTRFIDNLHELVENYNNTPHSSLKDRTPSDVFDDVISQTKAYRELTKYNKEMEDKIDLEVGDYVRRRVDRGRFDKEDAKFSAEIYVVAEQDGHKYRIMDADQKVLPRKYKYFELSKVDPKVVEGRLGKSRVKPAVVIVSKKLAKTQAEEDHKKQTRLARNLGVSYDEAGKLMDKYK